MTPIVDGAARSGNPATPPRPRAGAGAQLDELIHALHPLGHEVNATGSASLGVQCLHQEANCARQRSYVGRRSAAAKTCSSA